MANLETQMRHRDREMVPRVLVQAMFALMFASVALVAYAQYTGRPNVGVPVASAVSERAVVTLTGDRTGVYSVQNASGQTIAVSSESKAGFIGVVGRVVDRKRHVHGIPGNPPLEIHRREDGTLAIFDPATDSMIELIGYGRDNVAAIARLLN